MLPQQKLLDAIKTTPLHVSLFGEFSSGKTTFLNALLGDDLLSVSLEPTTAVPTFIRYGRSFNLHVEKSNGSRLTFFEGTPPFWARFVGNKDMLGSLMKEKENIREFLAEWTKEDRRASEVKRLEMEIPSPWLEGNIVLVDTPGTNVEVERHRNFTDSVIGNTDVALFLIKAKGGKASDYSTLNRIGKQVDRTIVVLNMMDQIQGDKDENLSQKEAREEVLANAKATLSQHWMGGNLPEIVPTSGLVRLNDDIAKANPELINSFNYLLNELRRWSQEERSRVVLKRLGSPEKEYFESGCEKEKRGLFNDAMEHFHDLKEVLQVAGLDPKPALDGLMRCHRAMEGLATGINNAAQFVADAREAEKKDLYQALELYRQASSRYKAAEVTDEAIEDVQRLERAIKIYDNLKKIPEKCKDQQKECLEHLMNITPSFNHRVDVSELNKILGQMLKIADHLERQLSNDKEPISGLKKSVDKLQLFLLKSSTQRLEALQGKLQKRYEDDFKNAKEFIANINGAEHHPQLSEVEGWIRDLAILIPEHEILAPAREVLIFRQREWSEFNVELRQSLAQPAVDELKTCLERWNGDYEQIRDREEVQEGQNELARRQKESAECIKHLEANWPQDLSYVAQKLERLGQLTPNHSVLSDWRVKLDIDKKQCAEFMNLIHKAIAKTEVAELEKCLAGWNGVYLDTDFLDQIKSSQAELQRRKELLLKLKGELNQVERRNEVIGQIEKLDPSLEAVKEWQSLKAKKKKILCHSVFWIWVVVGFFVLKPVIFKTSSGMTGKDYNDRLGWAWVFIIWKPFVVGEQGFWKDRISECKTLDELVGVNEQYWSIFRLKRKDLSWNEHQKVLNASLIDEFTSECKAKLKSVAPAEIAKADSAKRLGDLRQELERQGALSIDIQGFLDGRVLELVETAKSNQPILMLCEDLKNEKLLTTGVYSKLKMQLIAEASAEITKVGSIKGLDDVIVVLERQGVPSGELQDLIGRQRVLLEKQQCELMEKQQRELLEKRQHELLEKQQRELMEKQQRELLEKQQRELNNRLQVAIGKEYNAIFQALLKLNPKSVNWSSVDCSSVNWSSVDLSSQQGKYRTTIPDLGLLNLTMVFIFPGQFQMGSTNGDSDEKPVHTVLLIQPFWLGQYEVTQAQWRCIMGDNPSRFKGADLPVEQVSWDNAMVFCQRLTARERQAGRLPQNEEYTLPTEAQWEYACRAGSTGDYAGDLDSMAWYSNDQTHPVGQKKTNAWGLYDMHGNVWEWCADWYGDYPSGSVVDPTGPPSGRHRVDRGGGWGNSAENCRSADRDGDWPVNRFNDLGFRLCRRQVGP